VALGGGGRRPAGLADWARSDETETSVITRRKNTSRSIDRRFTSCRAAFVISITTAGEESSSIRAIAARAVK
jgi:hypothetical protein